MTPDMFFSAASIGIGATAFMDLIAFVQKHLLHQPALDYAMVGRWCGHVVRGRFIHRPISSSRPIPFERPLGWAVHYMIGILFALCFLAMVGPDWREAPQPWPALAFGMLSVLAPFVILQPGMGAGLAARRLPHPTIARLRSLIAHLSFGLGLWVAAICLP